MAMSKAVKEWWERDYRWVVAVLVLLCSQVWFYANRSFKIDTNSDSIARNERRIDKIETRFDDQFKILNSKLDRLLGRQSREESP